ncbi:conserved protein of unknown function [Xenorhabdus doucetiae]|uniref:Uncharacterized protein n=1 Tax=Xenorhabdus doucetiae TaxID=351671 RepID=A0A068QSI2_9GAMM|nr:conserved protein of unknown function [Xenorhabdus doucetiae]
MFPVSTGINRFGRRYELEVRGVPREYGDKPRHDPVLAGYGLCSP